MIRSNFHIAVRFLIAVLSVPAMAGEKLDSEAESTPRVGESEIKAYIDCINNADTKETGLQREKALTSVRKVTDSCKEERQNLLTVLPGERGQKLIERIEQHLQSRQQSGKNR